MVTVLAGDALLEPTFHNLPSDRQQAFMQACMEEFVDHGYERASTNHIVGRLGISKGLFFKYAGSKRALFLHLVQEILEELGSIQGAPGTYRSRDLFVRLEELNEAFIAYAVVKPLHYRFGLVAALDSGSLQGEVDALRLRVSDRTLGAIYQGVEWGLYCLPRAEVEQVFLWQLRSSQPGAIQQLRKDFSIETYRTFMRGQLALLRKLLRGGIYRGKASP